jgi:hypothetical protein
MRGTYQKILEDGVGLWVGEELREPYVGGLEDYIGNIRVLGKESMGDGDRS